MAYKALVVIPAFNEQETIGAVIEDVTNVAPGMDILVVNDASEDNTAQIARESQVAKVIDLPFNLGIGGAVQTGLKYAERKDYDCVIQFDADGQHHADDILKLVEMVRSGECDVAIGSRFVGDKQLFESDFLRRLGIRIFEFFSLLLLRKRIKDHTSGFRAFSKKTVHFIMHEYPVDYPEPEIVVYLAKNGFVIKETFTQMFSRQGGVSSISVLRGPYYMFKVLIAMLMAVLRPKENKL